MDTSIGSTLLLILCSGIMGGFIMFVFVDITLGVINAINIYRRKRHLKQYKFLNNVKRIIN